MFVVFHLFVLVLLLCLCLCVCVCGREVTSRVFEDLVLGSVLFSVVITGMVNTGSSQMGKFAGVTVPQGREGGEESEGSQEACTELSDSAALWWGWLKAAFMKQEDTSTWRREGWEHTSHSAGGLWDFLSEITEDVSDRHVRACCRWGYFQREIRGVLHREIFRQLQNRPTVRSSGRHPKQKNNC